MSDEPIYTLPPYVAQEVTIALSETVDWSLAVNKIPELQLAGHTGQGVRVAVLDTGVDEKHPDLQGALEGWQDFTGEGVTDRVGHGTHCAGVIAAQTNEFGTRGVAPKCKLGIFKCLTNSGGSDRWIGDAIRAAVNQGYHIISMSLGAPQPGQYLMAAIDYAYSKGVLVICAAGNDGRSDSVNWPAKSPKVLAVSAYDQQFNLAPFSSRGKEVDLAGPGVDILSCYKGQAYVKMSGTSMATPFVAGLAALVKEKHPGLNKPEELAQVLRKGAVDTGQADTSGYWGWVIRNPSDIFRVEAPPLPPAPTPVDPGAPGSIEIEVGGGIVLHIPALATDLFTAGVALKSGVTVNGNYDAVKLLRQIEQASRVAHSLAADCQPDKIQ